MREYCPWCGRIRTGVLFDIDSLDLCCPDGHHFPDTVKTTVRMKDQNTMGSLRGDTQIQESSLLNRYKNKCNPPQQASSEARFTSLHPRDFERMTLQEIQEWSLTHSKFETSDGDRWKAPECCVGILRYNTTGRVAGFVPCGSWHCPICGARKKIQLKKKS